MGEKEGRETKQKLSILWENEVQKGSGSSKTGIIGLKTSSSSDPGEKRKNKRAGGNWKQSEGSFSSSHPKSLEEKEGGKTQNKALNGSESSSVFSSWRKRLYRKRRPSFGLMST